MGDNFFVMENKKIFETIKITSENGLFSNRI